MATGSDLVKKALSPDYYSGGLGAGFAAVDVAAIASADNKTKALLSTLKDLVSFNLIGWAGTISGALFGIRVGVKAMIVDSGSLQKALENLSRTRFYESQFAPFLKGAGSARQRLAELMALAGKPFNLASLVSASRSLEVFTRGAYSSDSALRTIVDSAAHAGQSVEDVSGTVGELYSTLRDGEPIGSTADQLSRLGVITPQVARELEQMQQRGSSLPDMFALVTSEMARTSGAGDAASESMEALGTQYDEAKTKLNQAFTGNFLQSSIEGTKNTIAVMQQLAPVAATVGRALGGVVTFGENLLSWAARALTAIPGLSTVAGALTRTLVVLGAVMGGVTALRWAVFIVQASQAVLAFLPRLSAMTAAIRAQAAAWFGSSQASATASASARARVTIMEAEVLSITEGTAATEASTVATGALAVAEEEAAAATRTWTAAFLALPWGWIILGVSLLIGVLSELVASSNESQKAVEDLASSGIDAVNKLQEQAGAMKDLDDQQDALTDSTRKLIAARQHLASLEVSGASPELIDQAKVNVKNLEMAQQGIENTAGLQPTRAYQQTLEQRAQQRIDLQEAEYQRSLSLASPRAAMDLRHDRIVSEKRKVQQGKDYEDADELAKKQEIGLQANYDSAEQSASALDTQLGITGATPEEKQHNRDALRARLEQKRQDSADAIQQAALTGTRAPSSLIFNEKDQGNIDVLNTQSGYSADQRKAQEGLRRVRLDSTNRIVQGYAVADADQRRAQTLPEKERNNLLADVAQRRSKLDVERKDITDPNRAARVVQMRAEQDAQHRQMDANQIELDVQKQIATLRLRGMDAAEEESRIRIAGLNQQLQTQTYLDEQGKEALHNRIAEEQKSLALMEQAARVQREADDAHLRIADIDRRTVEATVGGKFGEAAKLRDQSIKESDAQAYKESVTQKVNSGQYSQSQAEDAAQAEQTERQSQRDSERLEFFDQTNRATEEQRLNQSRSPEDRIKGREMGDVDTARGRISDALKANLSPEEAASYAEKAGNLDLEKELKNNGSRGVIADSLQRIGGGGGVGGLDPSQELARRRTDLIQSIHDMLRDRDKKPENGPPPTTFG